MFDRPNIKQRAKNDLKGHYWIAFAVSIIVGLLTGEVSGLNLNFNINTDLLANSYDYGYNYGAGYAYGYDIGDLILSEIESLFSSGIGIVLTFVALLVLLIAFAFSLVLTYFIIGPIEVGSARFFINLTRGEANFKDLIYGFQNNYKNVCKVMFRRYIYLFLWGLLSMIPVSCLIIGVVLSMMGGFVGVIFMMFGLLALFPALVPAMVKGYEYALIPYLLAEFPDMQDAFAATKQLTKGHKWDLFVLELSFMGWFILGAMCLGVGTWFVLPYFYASMAEAYATICALKAPPAPQGENVYEF